MTKEKVIPQIRFSGFTDTWEQRELGELVEFYNGDRSSRYPNDSDMVSDGVPFINAGDLVSGRVKLDTANKITEEKFNELSGAKIQRGDIIYCLRGTLGKNAFVDNFDVGTVASSLVDIRPKKVVGKYLFQVLNSDIEYTQRTVNDEGAAQPNLSAKNLSLFNIPMPDEIEQEKIAAYFDDLDRLITLHQRKYDKLTKVKKAMLEKMFPKNGSLYPEIRFKDFTDAWEQRKFREQYQKITEKNDLSFGADKIISVANMYFKSDVKQSDDDYMRSYNIMRLGDIAFEGNKSKHFAHGRFVENTIGDGIVSHVFDVFRPIADYDLLFWKYLINYEGVMGRIMTRCTKASTMMTNLVADDFLAESILVPSIQEQQKIGAFLDKLDSLITLHQRKLEKLKNIKKACLEKMFV